MDFRTALQIAQDYGIWSDYSFSKAEKMLCSAIEWEQKCQKLTNPALREKATQCLTTQLQVAAAVEYIARAKATGRAYDTL